MQQWEYVDYLIDWDTAHKDWVVKLRDEEIAGMLTILGCAGSNGWELVNMLPEYSKEVKISSGSYVVERGHAATMYRAVFKRPKQ